jgi:hypothetical protein
MTKRWLLAAMAVLSGCATSFPSRYTDEVASGYTLEAALKPPAGGTLSVLVGGNLPDRTINAVGAAVVKSMDTGQSNAPGFALATPKPGTAPPADRVVWTLSQDDRSIDKTPHVLPVLAYATLFRNNAPVSYAEGEAWLTGNIDDPAFGGLIADVSRKLFPEPPVDERTPPSRAVDGKELGPYGVL